ncbi:hypothetical protein RF11_05676 [Thelohanellus kitauei]|uniref:ISXO2-like transposase domain-containing protein n=1 Tax=Thelohanellus kitauei TaxID=669202 RepID=A0A0C2LZS4_THEKT|nr:hypothetical protein RF11_05676 [Thelohanellus kitauei]
MKQNSANENIIVEDWWMEETKDCFLIPVPKRDRDTLLPIIIDNALPETTIITDCWKAYECLAQEDYNYLKVNHSINFVDPQSGAHTQNIESTWWQIKRNLPQTHTRKDRLYLYLGEYLWRKMAQKSGVDVFEYFLECVSNIY